MHAQPINPPGAPPPSPAAVQVTHAEPWPRACAQTSLAHLLAAMLNEIDYGMLLIADNQRVLHANHVASADLDDQHPLRLEAGELHARHPRDAAPLHDAIVGACQRGKRRLVTLGEEPQRVTIAVVPVPTIDQTTPSGALVMLGKRQVCQALSVEAFARCHKLTPTETAVLMALCSGTRPTEIAMNHGVALSTVRTQVSSIRAKTGTENISSLVRMVAMLPPMVSALRQVSTASLASRPRPVVVPRNGSLPWMQIREMATL
jgi:DNA-binding CsgD family transcriptional regulator